jgi:peptidyl-tRNA hydrolase, PTH1 family
MKPFVIAGLGNFPLEYHKHRHNVGFVLLDKLQEVLGFDDFKLQAKFQADVSAGMFDEKKVLLMKPQTYMNRSGYAIAEAVNFFKVPLEQLIVVYDDVDLPLGEVRHRTEGSAGTHNGMKSILDSLGEGGFQRVRIGIENRTEEMKKKMNLSDYVLGRFEPGEESLRDDAINEAVLMIKELIEEG